MKGQKNQKSKNKRHNSARVGGVDVQLAAVLSDGAPRTFDISKATVLKKNPYMAIVLLPHADGDLEVTLQNVNGKWMIDSPMF